MPVIDAIGAEMWGKARWRPKPSAIPVVAAAMIDRLVHHAEVINLKGDSYRLKAREESPMTTLRDQEG
jgi:hypothetical protein